MKRKIALVALCSIVMAHVLSAAPYASKVRINGTTVTFILNEPADVLLYRVSNGPLQALDASTKGVKTFSLNNTKDRFSIMAGKSATVGYTVPTGETHPLVLNGLSQKTAASGFNLISDDSNPLTHFNSPRGVSVSKNPNATNFGTVYLANSAAGTIGSRSVGDGLYAMNADQSDAFGYGDVAQDPANYFNSQSANSPFRVHAATNGEVYTADFSDASSGVYRANANLTIPIGGVQVFSGTFGPFPLPPGQNHGSAMSVYVEGSLATSNLTVYTTDEDYTSSGQNDRSSLWSYALGAGPLTSNITPIRINQSIVMVPVAVSDVDRGNDGKWYLSQNRIDGNEAGIVVLDTNGSTLFDSLSASRTHLGNPAAVDIFRNVFGTAVSEDQQWLAALLNNSDVAIIPLVNGIPDIARRLLVDTGVAGTAGRDVSFDAAGNIHYVSVAQGGYRVLAPGGTTWATTTRLRDNYSFSITPLPELEITRTNGQIRIDWPFGTLQESTSVSGTFTNSAVQVSPYIFTPTVNAKFFRLLGL